MNCSSCSAEVSSRAPFCAVCGARVEDPFIGMVVNNRYRVEAKIAVGGFGAIYRATQLTNGRNVAIKVMHKELGADENLVARFRREGIVLCSLRDAHTVTTYELDETPDGRLFIVMELLSGKNLLEVFRAEGRLPWDRMFAIARSICSALAEAHTLGIVHRDLKPANIYLEARHDGADFVKVLDFGIAKVMQESGINDGKDLTIMGQAVGTVEYMAPEQLMGGKCDGRTDIYTVGILLFEMITGNRPFSAVGLDLLTVQLTQRVPAPSEFLRLSAPIDRLIVRCLEPDAADRYADVNELASAIDDVLASEAAVYPTWTPQPPPAVITELRTDPISGDTVRQIVPAPSPITDRDVVPAPITDRQAAPSQHADSRLDPMSGDTVLQLDPPTTTITIVKVEPARPAPAVPAIPFEALPKPRPLEIPFVQTVVARERPPRELDPRLGLLILLVIGLGVGAVIAWLL
ncbi:MAG: serine/threonine protein kinase [Myxococcales bacterium]|nr:serine/threonine protein kinase [Myxococcales bacterium]